jgi:hypothetical protein
MVDRDTILRVIADARSAGHDVSNDDMALALDDLVHDVKSHEASAINNSGIDTQVEFLLNSGVTEDEIAAAIRGDDPAP